MSHPRTRPNDSARTIRQWRITAGQVLPLLAILVMSSVPFLARNFTKAKSKSTQLGTQQERPERVRLSESVSVHSSGRQNPLINLSDGQDVLTSYVGPEGSRIAVQQNRAEPLSLASADFDEDGVPDLISGYGYEGRGIVTLLRGNVDSIYPNAPEAQERQANGTFTAAPFLSPARVFEAIVPADFIGAGDFDCDTHWDIVMASRGGSALYLLSGDGKGSLGSAKVIELPGAVTALTVGEINRRDGLTDVVVAVQAPEGARVLIFEGADGALRREPEVFSMPAAVTSLALGQLDNEYSRDLAVAAGHELLIVQGRDRKLSLDREQRATVLPAQIDKHSFPTAIKWAVIGDFSGKQFSEIAVLTEDGALQLMGHEEGTNEKQITQSGASRRAEWQSRTLPVGPWPGVSSLASARSSSLPSDDLVLLDSRNPQLHILSRLAQAGTQEGATAIGSQLESAVLAVDGGLPVAVLPMRLTEVALSDLVVLTSGQSAAIVVEPEAVMTFTVNSAADTNDGICNVANCTLREAINAANANLGADTIKFSIGSGVRTINVGSNGLGALPHILEPVTIDATTQPGFTGTPLIELNGIGAGSSAEGLAIDAGSSTLRGFVVNRFSSNGIIMSGFGSNNGNNRIEGNYIGTNISGISALPNGGLGGLLINDSPNNVIGGTTSAARNVISGNASLAGLTVFLPGAHDNQVQGNYIGTNANGTSALGNSYGIFVSRASANLVGGTIAGSGNVISGNAIFGIQIQDNPAFLNSIQGNRIGTNSTASSAVGNDSGIFTLTDNNTVGGTTVSARNIISGNFNTAITVTNGTGPQGTRIQGNYIGTDVTGTGALGNSFGILVSDGSENQIGGTLAGARNIIAGNRTFGVQIQGSGAFLNRVQGNYIGTDVTGTVRLGNDGGVYLLGNFDKVGGTEPSERNVISGNLNVGLTIALLTNGEQVQGNYIGVDVNGAPLGNTTFGVYLFNTDNNMIGGTEIGSKNTISSNGAAGLVVYGGASNFGPARNARFNQILGNLIGTDPTGTINRGNGSDGIQITQATDNTIGGPSPEARNIISANLGNGVAVGIRVRGPGGEIDPGILPGTGGNAITVQGNYIGTDITGNLCLGNRLSGIFVDADSFTDTIRDNLSACNGGNGVNIPANNNPAVEILIDSNLIFKNSLLGIDLGPTGVTPNDILDLDGGANNLQNFPVLTSYSHNALLAIKDPSGVTPENHGETIIVNGSFNSTPNSVYKIDWFFSIDSECANNQSGTRPLAFGRVSDVRTDPNGNAVFAFPFTFPPGTSSGIINCTARDSLGNTSEFSACLPVIELPPRMLTLASVNPSSGVSIVVSPNDNSGQSSGTTQFTRTYNDSTNVILTTPATVGGNNFQKWLRDGADFANNQLANVSVTMDANHTMTAVYVTPTRTLTVASSNPGSGVSVTVSPNDNSGSGSGTTQFTRTYNNNQSVSLTAAATAGGNNFQKWLRDGADFANNQLTSVSVTMDANHTLTAVYVTATRTLTVASTNPSSGVNITVSPNDNGAQGNGTTQFIRTYNNSTVVSLTAPATALGNNFQKWLKDGADFPNNQLTNVSVTMDANHTMTAVYVTPTCTLTVASTNPSSGVSVIVSPNDNNAQGNGSTQFTRTYNQNTNVSLAAPATAGGNSFQKWLKDGADFANNQLASVSVTMDANYTMTAVYVTPTRTLTVASNPSSGVSITVSPNDNNSAGNGSTPFTRLYNNNTVVSLTAPATAGGDNFQKWLKDGADFANNQLANVSVTMDANHTMTAVYLTATRTLTVASTNPSSGVTITVSPNDNGQQGNGTTQFTRTYNNSTVVTLTAPATASGNNFQKWQRDGVDFATTQATAVTMDANHTMAAIYVTPQITQYLLTMIAGIGGTVSPASGLFNVGTSVSILATANLGYDFSGWAGSGAGSFTGATSGASVTMNGPVTETANFTARFNPLEDRNFFVRQTYRDFLDRDADLDPVGFNYWSGEIAKCGTDASCIRKRRIGVSAAFFVENEFQRTGSFVYRLYKGGLARRPSYQEFNADRVQIRDGVTLEADKQALALSFVQRSAFVQKYVEQTTANAFVDALITSILQASNLDLANQRSVLISKYNIGTSMHQSRALALRETIDSAAFVDPGSKEYNAAFVLMQYFGYLRRDPEQAGYDFWLGKVNNPSEASYRSMVCAFLTSEEYQLRFSSLRPRTDAECADINE